MEIDQVKRFGYSPEEFRKFKIYAWRFLLGFSFLYMCIYCCRLNLAAVMPLMMEEEGWTTVDIGIITGTLFWTYGFGHLINGRLGEIFGSNRFVILSVILSVSANILISFQSSIIIIAIIWGFNGYFQSMAWSPGMSALIKWWPGDKRGFATGLAHAFSAAGQAVCILAVTLALIQPGVLAQVLLFVSGFCIYAINGLCWAYACDVGGRAFAGTAAGILDWAAYMGAGSQAVVFGVILNSAGWTSVFVTISVSLLFLVAISWLASRGANKEKL